MEVVHELREERRREGMGVAKIGRGSRPFILVGGRRRHRGFNGRHQCRVSKTLVTYSEEGGADLRLS
jgi:hypothetical protein